MKVEQQIIKFNKEIFTRGTYNGISVIIREKDKFANATFMCNQFGKRFRKLLENKAWKEYLASFTAIFYARPNSGGQEKEPVYQLNSGIPTDLNDIRGYYVDQRLLNYIAIWASPTYAVTVGVIMDSINNKIHEELQEKQLQDTVENAKPIFKKVVNEIVAPNNEAYEQQYAWGVRGSSTKLDYWEREELYSDIKAYNNLKEQFAKAQEKINSWSSYAEEYFPGLMQ